MISGPLPPPGRDPRLPPADPLPIPAELQGQPAARSHFASNNLPTGEAGIPQLQPGEQIPVSKPLSFSASNSGAAPPAKSAPPARRPQRSRRELTHVQRAVTAADEAGFSTLEKELGGRPALVAILAGADLNGDEARVMGLLADPQNDTTSLAKVCVGAGISMARLMKLFQAAALVKGQTKAIQRIAERLPDVAAAIMEDAIPREKECPICDGLTTVPGRPTKENPDPEPVKCTVCKGKGTVPFVPEHQVREMALRIGGLLEKGGGSGVKVLVANQNNGAGVSVADTKSFDSLMAAVDGALYGEGRARQRTGEEPIDGEVVG